MPIVFTALRDQKEGTIAALLKRSYAELVASEPKLWGAEAEKWERFDKEVFERRDTVGACVFFSWDRGQLVGFASYDPRLKPQAGIVGHNCILPEFRGKGYGRLQIEEILRRFRDFSMRVAKTATLAGEWHLPARRMYLACGFKETGRRPWNGHASLTLIEYEKQLLP